MKYDGIETEVLLKKNEKEIFFILVCFLAEGAGYLLYKHADRHPAIGILAILFFITVIVLCMIIAMMETLPLRLKYIHHRKDIPKYALGIDYWCCFGRAIPAILGMFGHSVHSIWTIIHGGYLLVR